MTNKPFPFKDESPHRHTYEATDENNENYLMEFQEEDDHDHFDDNDF